MNCPACGRKLLSLASARCNWCGETIPDAEFQAHADAARAEYFAHIAAHDAASLLATESFPMPAFVPHAQRGTHAAPQSAGTTTEAVTTEEEDVCERFRHLEL